MPLCSRRQRDVRRCLWLERLRSIVAIAACFVGFMHSNRPNRRCAALPFPSVTSHRLRNAVPATIQFEVRTVIDHRDGQTASERRAFPGCLGLLMPYPRKVLLISRKKADASCRVLSRHLVDLSTNCGLGYTFRPFPIRRTLGSAVEWHYPAWDPSLRGRYRS